MRVRLQNGEVCFLRDSGERVVSEDSVATCSATWSFLRRKDTGCKQRTRVYYKFYHFPHKHIN